MDRRSGSPARKAAYIAILTVGVALTLGFTVRGLASGALIGAFAGYVLIYHDKAALRQGAVVRCILGALVGLAIGAICGFVLPGVLLGPVAGALFGYFGPRWMQYL